MKWRVEVSGREYLLDLRRNGRLSHYQVEGHFAAGGSASIEEVAPGVFSILDGFRSFTVRLVRNGEQSEAWVDGRRYVLEVSDPRDRRAESKGASANGAQEVRALMPGKVVKLLVAQGDAIEAGAGLIVVEAMKMQNEMKSHKDGRVKKILVAEGATVGPGELLVEIE